MNDAVSLCGNKETGYIVKLKPEPSQKAIVRFERAGIVPAVGTEVLEIMDERPSRFGKTGGSTLEQRKRTVIEAIQAFIDRFKGLGAR